MEQWQLGQLQALAGPEVGSLLSTKERTEQALNDPNPKIRWAAVTLMTYHWGATPACLNKCEELAVRDPDGLVRSAALGCLGWCFREPDDRRIATFLAKAVCDDSEASGTRVSAYIALLSVSGELIESPWSHGEMFPYLRFPEDVDWALVGSMLAEDGEA